MRNDSFDIAAVTLNSGVEIAGLEAANTQFYSNAEVFRTTSLTDVEIQIVFNDPGIVSGLVLWRHNLSATATVQWRGYGSNDLTGVPVFDSGVVDAVEAKSLGELEWGVEALGANIFDRTAFEKKFTEIWLKNNDDELEPIAVRSQSIVINDPDNPDLFIDLARIYNGLAQSPKTNFSYGAKMSPQVTSSAGVSTADGSFHTVYNPAVRHLDFNLQWLDEYERPKFTEFFSLVGLHQDFYLSLYPGESGQKRRDHAFAAKCKTIPSNTHNFHNNYSMPVNAREV